MILTLVHFYLVSRPIPDTTLVQLSLNILRYPTLHSCSVHPTYIFRFQTNTKTRLSITFPQTKSLPGRKELTGSLPPRDPAALRVYDRDDPFEMRRRADLDAVRVLLHLHDLLAVRAPVPFEVAGCLDDGAEETSTKLLCTRLARNCGLDLGHGDRANAVENKRMRSED